MTEFDTASFKEAIRQEQPVVVDFWAPWCMPCKLFAPTLEALSDELDGTAVFGKVNVDDCSELAVEYEVATIPTVIIFKKGEVLERFSGTRPKEEVLRLIMKRV